MAGTAKATPVIADGNEPTSFGVEIFDYSLSINGDPSVYADHEFTVRVWMGQHMYAIQRSYSSFCLFDAQLRRRYPRSKLPVLPLSGKEQFKLLKTGGAGSKLTAGALAAEDSIKAAVGTLGATISVFGNGVAASSAGSAGSTAVPSAAGGAAAAAAAAAAASSSASSAANASAPASATATSGVAASVSAAAAAAAAAAGQDTSGFESSGRMSMRESAGRRSIRRLDNSEVIQQKKMPLTLYLQHLLTIPEILQSDSLLAFLDEEYPDGEAPDEDKLHATVTSIDLLLADEAAQQKRVLRQHAVSLHLEEGFVVAWKFQTRNHDIGFSVSFNDTEILTYQRVNSHVKPVTGLFEAPAKGTLALAFDNTYSRMHTKHLAYWLRVVEGPEYEVAKETAIYKAKERAALQQQRALLHKSLESLLADLIRAGAGTGLAYNSEEAALAARFRMRTTSTWEGELSQLRDEKKSLTLALEESIRALEVERNAFADSVGRLEAAGASREAVEEELAATRSELEQLRLEAVEEREKHAWAVQELQASRDKALEAIDQARREMSEAKALKDQGELVEALRGQLAQQQEDAGKLSDQISRLKAEKKLLKTSYLQAKADGERVAHERQMQAAETDRLREELRVAIDSLASAQERRQISIDRAGESAVGGGAAGSIGGGLLSAYANDLSEKLSKIGESVFRPQTPGLVSQQQQQLQQQQQQQQVQTQSQYPPTLFVDNSFGF